MHTSCWRSSCRLQLPGLPAGWRCSATEIGLDLDNSRNFYIVVAVIAFLVAAFLLRLTQSPFGKVLTAIRENELRTRFIGFDVDAYKLLAFVLSAAITGLAGGLAVLSHRDRTGSGQLAQFLHRCRGDCVSSRRLPAAPDAIALWQGADRHQGERAADPLYRLRR